MAELTVSQLIKIIIGIFVFAAMVGGAYLFFKNQIVGFFQNVPTGEPVNLIVAMFKSNLQLVAVS